MTDWGTKLKNVVSDFAVGVSGMDGGIGMAGRGLAAQMDRRNQRQTYGEALNQFMNGNTPAAYQTMADNGYGQEALSYAMSDKQRQEEGDLRKELEMLKDNRTSDVKNFEYLLASGYSPEQARAIAFGGNTEAVGNALVTGDLSRPLGQKGNDEYDKQMGKALAEERIKQEAAQASLAQLLAIRERILGENGLSQKAQIDTFVDRNIPTQFVDKSAQKARQEIQNLLGSLRLDQMQYLKGAISDKEQAFLADMVANDISKYTPEQIEGALNGIVLKLNAIINKNPNVRIPTDEDAWGGI